METEDKRLKHRIIMKLCSVCVCVCVLFRISLTLCMVCLSLVSRKQTESHSHFSNLHIAFHWNWPEPSGRGSILKLCQGGALSWREKIWYYIFCCFFLNINDTLVYLLYFFVSINSLGTTCHNDYSIRSLESNNDLQN